MVAKPVGALWCRNPPLMVVNVCDCVPNAGPVPDREQSKQDPSL